MTVQIKITSDFICPWCLIGGRRLLAAISALPPDITVETDFLPFELNPDMPAEGMERKVYRSLKFGSWERSRQLDSQTMMASNDTNVNFNYDAIDRTPNTFNAHRLVWLASKEGKQGEVVDAVLAAYFERGRNIGEVNTLIAIGEESGLDREAVSAALQGDAAIKEVRELERFVLQSGVRGVPNFVIGEAVIGGAQPAEALRTAIVAEHERAPIGDTQPGYDNLASREPS